MLSASGDIIYPELPTVFAPMGFKPTVSRKMRVTRPDKALYGVQSGVRTIGLMFLLALVFTLASLPAGHARTVASFVVDADTGKVLHAYRPDTKVYPASLTKIMTLYMTFEALKTGKLKVNQKLTVSREATRTRPSWLALKPGQRITVDQAIRGLVIKSANDAARVLAEAIAGSEAKFAQRMTAKARKIGMKRTVFRNASGLPNRSQVTTARDMSTLGLRMIRDFPQYYAYFSQRSFRFGKSTFRNHNQLLTADPGTDGIKTGFINASGFNLVASVKRYDRRLVGVVIGGRTGKSRNARMIKLLDNAFLKLRRSGAIAALPAPRLAPGGKILPAQAQIAMQILRSGPEAIPTGQGSADWSDASFIGSAHAAALPGTDIPGTERQWGIQVGAFYSRSQAERASIDAARRLPDLLRLSKAVLIPERRGSRTLYRARLLGMNERQAREACRVLGQIGRDCIAVAASR